MKIMNIWRIHKYNKYIKLLTKAAFRLNYPRLFQSRTENVTEVVNILRKVYTGEGLALIHLISCGSAKTYITERIDETIKEYEKRIIEILKDAKK